MTQAPDSFTTERLEARRSADSDRDFLLAMWSDPRVTDWLGGPRDLAAVVALQHHWDELWEHGRYGAWIVQDRTDGEPLGWVLLHPMDFGGTVGTEVGWAMRPDRWGLGLTSEAAARVVDIGFGDLGYQELISGTMTTNVASERVMQKLGFACMGETEHAGLPHVLYRLSRNDWEQRNG